MSPDVDTPAETVAAEAPGRADDDRRWALFHVVAVLGILVGAVLGILQVLDRPTIRLDGERVRREGLVSTVQVLATNTSDEEAYCVDIRITALDREGLDLQDVGAEAQRGDGRLEPRQTMNFVAVLDGLTAQDYAEKLDEFDAYVESSERC